MEKNLLQNTFSIITKEEDVKTMNHHILRNTFVLEITRPFPGYYFSSDFITAESKPQNILIVLKNEVSLEVFYRKIKKIKKYADFTFGAEMATVHIFNQKYYAIRVNSLETYDSISDLQKHFLDEGFLLRKPTKIEDKALIKIFKFSNLRFENDIYHNIDDAHFIYFGINQELTWKQFAHITLKIRHNVANKKFDAGLGVFFHDGNIEDVIRIYTKDLTDEEAKALKALYIKELTS
mgnify:CR=1 FL=1